MKASTLDVLVWVLIYGGLLTLVLGLAVRGRTALGDVLAVAGGAVAVAGAALLWWRSRRGDDA